VPLQEPLGAHRPSCYARGYSSTIGVACHTYPG
jgi:hypothetical protein